jgi:acetylornithine deacetylase
MITRDDATRLLSDLVAIDSVNPSLVPGAAGEARIAGFVAAWLANAGLEVELAEAAPGRPSVVGRRRGRGGGRTLMLNAHMDTVGVAGMPAPFEPRVEDGRLYGRGAYDMKGSLAAIMLAARMLGTGELRGDVLVTAVADEEYASLGTQAVVRDHRADGAIVTEPTGVGRVCVAHKGFAWLKVETVGRAAHGSKPDLGVDAIAHMGRVLAGLDGLSGELSRDPGHHLLGPASIHASLIEGGQELSSYPASCRLQIERRTLPGETPDVVRAEIERIVQRCGAADAAFRAQSDLFFWRDPFEVDPEEEIVRILVGAVSAETGIQPLLYGDTPWMDAALLSAAGIPTVVYGPGGGGAHAVEEWSNLDEVATCAEVLARVARQFCA